MPIFDVRCTEGHDTEQIIPRADRLLPCQMCGADVERRWSPSVHVRDDSIPGGMVIENMGHDPMTFYSHSDYRLEMKARGLVNQVSHACMEGTDKAKHTTRWT